MRLQNLSYVTLWSVKFDEMRRLYKEVLGLPLLEENSSFMMFETRGSRLAFHRLAKGPRIDRRSVELHFEVNDVDEVYDSLQRKGVKFEEKPANRPWGTRMASFHDPEGYAVEIVGPLKREDTLSKGE